MTKYDKSHPIMNTGGTSRQSPMLSQEDKERNENPLPRREREHPSTYFVQDRSNQDELTRLRIQDQLVTASMGGVLPEQSDPDRFERVLDVGCGTGGWLIQLAQTSLGIKELVGVDVSVKMLEAAQALAQAKGVTDRVRFEQMDAIRMLEFPTNHFTLVNQRLGMSWLRVWDWPNVLREYCRVCEPQGVIRLTEGDAIIQSSSPALTELCQLLLSAFSQAGHYFVPESDGITSQLAPLLKRWQIRNVQTRSITMEYRTDTQEGKLFCEDLTLVFHTVQPFLRKWSRMPENYEALCEQAVADMHQPNFRATGRLLTAWGTNPIRNHSLGSSTDR